MRLDEIIENKFILNDELVYIVKEEIIKSEIELTEVDELSDMGRLTGLALEKQRKFASTRDGFKIAFHQVRIGETLKWMFYLLYEYQEKYYRVQIENSKCNNCENIFSIANPTLPNLFDFVKNERGILEEVKKLPGVNCPYCNHQVDRNAIWSER